MTGTVTIHVHPALAAGAPAGDELADRPTPPAAPRGCAISVPGCAGTGARRG